MRIRPQIRLLTKTVDVTIPLLKTYLSIYVPISPADSWSNVPKNTIRLGAGDFPFNYRSSSSIHKITKSGSTNNVSPPIINNDGLS